MDGPTDQATTEDEELPVTVSATQVTGVAEPIVVARGLDLEDVTVTPAPSGTEIVVTVDSDWGSDLDLLADVTRELTEALDGSLSGADVDDYSLQVTSPGVGRALTLDRHWRRARGRKVVVETDDHPAGAPLVGRVGDVHDRAVDLVVNERGRISVRTVPLTSMHSAITDVDFATPGAAELRRCGLSDAEVAARLGTG